MAAQAARAFAYGLGAVLSGAPLDERGFGSVEVGLVLGSVLAGTVIASLVIGRCGDTLWRWFRTVPLPEEQRVSP